MSEILLDEQQGDQVRKNVRDIYSIINSDLYATISVQNARS